MRSQIAILLLLCAISVCVGAVALYYIPKQKSPGPTETQGVFKAYGGYSAEGEVLSTSYPDDFTTCAENCKNDPNCKGILAGVNVSNPFSTSVTPKVCLSMKSFTKVVPNRKFTAYIKKDQATVFDGL